MDAPSCAAAASEVGAVLEAHKLLRQVCSARGSFACGRLCDDSAQQVVKLAGIAHVDDQVVVAVRVL
eukprot:373574-Prymnesium_polylepis.1